MLFKPAKINVLIISAILFLLINMVMKPVKSEQPLMAENNVANPLINNPNQTQLTPDKLSGPENQLNFLKHFNPFFSILEKEPPIVKGVYITGWMAGQSKYLEKMIKFSEQTEINSMVIDVKDDTGRISYLSRVPLAQSVSAGYPKFDPEKTTKLLRDHNIYPIARIVVFKDPHLAQKRPDLAVKSANGGIWKDYKGLAWVDPYNRKVWEYNIAVAKEAAGYGFLEIQFDYVRFTSDGNIKDCRYSSADNRSKSDTIAEFLKYAYQELKPLGVKISADVFGATCSASKDIGIGQVFEKIAENLDIICPMVYPSHYTPGEFNIPDPDRNPYQTVYRSLMDAKRKAAALKKPVIIRPWLQDFSLRNHYGREQLIAQIRAVQDAGFQEWIFWNPSNRYDIRKYRLKQEIQKKLDLSPVLLDPAVDQTIPIQNKKIPSLEGEK